MSAINLIPEAGDLPDAEAEKVEPLMPYADWRALGAEKAAEYLAKRRGYNADRQGKLWAILEMAWGRCRRTNKNMTGRDRAEWLADKIPACGDYAKEAAQVLIEQATEIERLRAALAKANEQAERFERGWYLRGDALESIHKHCEPQPSALAAVIVATCKGGLKA